MSRLPFDPDQALGSVGGDRPARHERKEYGSITETRHLTVSQVSELIKNTLEQRLPSPLRVLGEVSNLSDRNHWYFSLKDADAVLQCVAWSSTAKKFKVRPKDGDEVVATGHISHYGPQGRTQMYVTNLQQVGTGALERQFKALCDELRKLGYFDEERKKSLPGFPRRIAVITAKDSAAASDVIATAAHRCKAVGLLVVDVRVQGEGAAKQIANAIGWVDRNSDRLEVDAVIVTRGGGSMEDLWTFNERIVADAVLKCSLPTVAAIGHESDTTIIELVADVRAATPTQAVMRLVPDAIELSKQLEHLGQRLRFVHHRRLDHARQRLVTVERHPIFADPMRMIRDARERLKSSQRHFQQCIRHRVGLARLRLEQLVGAMAKVHPQLVVERSRDRISALRQRLGRSLAWECQRRCEHLTALERALAAVDPASVLQRGFSITFRRDGVVVRAVQQVLPGEHLLTRLAEGSVRSIVERLDTHGQSSRKQRRQSNPLDQLDLFAMGD